MTAPDMSKIARVTAENVLACLEHVILKHERSVLEVMHELKAENLRLRARVESLRGSLKRAAGWLEDEDAVRAADMCRWMAGDMEP